MQTTVPDEHDAGLLTMIKSIRMWLNEPKIQIFKYAFKKNKQKNSKDTFCNIYSMLLNDVLGGNFSAKVHVIILQFN